MYIDFIVVYRMRKLFPYKTVKQIHEASPRVVLVYGLGCLIFLMGAFFFGATQATPENTECTNIAEAFFPEQLRELSNQEFLAGGVPPSEFLSCASGDLDQIGMDAYIVAAYTNGFEGKVLVLKKQGEHYVVADEPVVPLFAGINPRVQMMQLDKDQGLEVVVSVSSARGPKADWIWDWNSKELSVIGPRNIDDNGHVYTVLSEADFTDLDGDGVKEIIQPPSWDTREGYMVYGLEGNILSEAMWYGRFVRSSGAPSRVERTFTVADPQGVYVITITNGENKKTKNVSSGTVTLNGTVLLKPKDFSKNLSRFSIPVTLKENNTIAVELNGAPGSQLIVTVTPQA